MYERDLDEVLHRLDASRDTLDNLKGLEFTFSAYLHETQHIKPTVTEATIDGDVLSLHFAPQKLHGHTITRVCWSSENLWHVCEISDSGMPLLGVFGITHTVRM